MPFRKLLPSPGFTTIATAARWLLWIILLLLLGWLAYAVTQLVGTNNDLSGALAKRSPVVEYITASNKTRQCQDVVQHAKDQHQADFLAHIAGLIQLQQDSPESAQLIQLLAADQQALSEDAQRLQKIDELCPYPTEPQFDRHGNLIGDPPVGPEPPAIPPVPTSSSSG